MAHPSCLAWFLPRALPQLLLVQLLLYSLTVPAFWLLLLLYQPLGPLAPWLLKFSPSIYLFLNLQQLLLMLLNLSSMAGTQQGLSEPGILC
jgi:hypothetical protein